MAIRRLHTTAYTPAFYNGGTSFEFGRRFTVTLPLELVELRWYRFDAGSVAPDGIRLWDDGVKVPWSGPAGAYGPLTDTGAAGWQTTALAGADRRALLPGHTYAVTFTFVGGTATSRLLTYTPTPDAGLVAGVQVQEQGGTGNVYPAGTAGNEYGVDLGADDPPGGGGPGPRAAVVVVA